MASRSWQSPLCKVNSLDGFVEMYFIFPFLSAKTNVRYFLEMGTLLKIVSIVNVFPFTVVHISEVRIPTEKLKSEEIAT